MSYPDFIEQLIIAKEYNSLTPAELQQVQEWIANEGEYNQIRDLLFVLGKATDTEETLQPPVKLKNDLKVVYYQKYNNTAKPNIRKRQIIVLISSAAALVLFAVSVFVFYDRKTPQLAEQQKPEIKKDSPAVETETIKKESENEITNNEILNSKSENKNEDNPGEIIIPEPQPSQTAQNNSVSAAQQPDLMALTITVF